MKCLTLFFIRIVLCAFLCFFSLNAISNSYPNIDTDNDGHVDWFEFDVLKNGQVDPQWDYGMTGLINTYEYVDPRILNETGEATPSRINFCETEQSNRLQEHINAYLSLLEDEGNHEVLTNSVVCKQQKIITINESIEPNSSESVEGFVYAKLYGVFSSEENISELESFTRPDELAEVGFVPINRGNAIYNENKLVFSSSTLFDFTGVSELYLDIEIRSKLLPDPKFNFDYLMSFDKSVGFEVEFSSFLFENIAAFYILNSDDSRCDSSSYRILDMPFDSSVCGVKKIRIPLNSVLKDGVPTFGGKYKNNVSVFNTISIELDRWRVQRFCSSNYEFYFDCQSLAVEYEIKSIKIVGGDRFPHDPEEYLDTDNDGLGSYSDPDNDNDGVQNELDAFPYDPIASADMDADGVANVYDIDMDGDGVPGLVAYAPFSSTPELGFFGTEIVEDIYERAWTDTLFDDNPGNDLDRTSFSEIAAILGVSNDNPLIMTTPQGGEFTWAGGNEFSGDADDDGDGYTGELDKFPKDPSAWADVDNDCVPDNVDNDLNSIPDTDCDGLNDALDTDDDNDTIPDNLTIPIISDGIPSKLWRRGVTIKDELDGDLCVIDDFVSSISSLCSTEVSYVPADNNLGSGIMKITVPKKSESDQAVEVEFQSTESINIQSYDPGGCGLPAGYLELETKILGDNGNEEIGISISTTKNNVSEVLPKNLKEYWPLIHSGQWVPLKIPLYEFFNSVVLTQYEYFDLNNNDNLSSIIKLAIHSKREEDTFSILIKNIRVVIRDKYPLSGLQSWCNPPGMSRSSIDFDNDGLFETSEGANRNHPFSMDVDRVLNSEEEIAVESENSMKMTWDFDGSGHADALTDGLLLLRYGFDLHGENLIKDVMHPSSSMTASEIEERLKQSANIIDIDMDGEFSALTDGLMLLRYMFDITGQDLIANTLSDTASRSSLVEIKRHITCHMPESSAEYDCPLPNGNDSIRLYPEDSGEIFGDADYFNSDFIKMNTVGPGELSIEITPDDSRLDIDCGLTTVMGPSVFYLNTFILDGYNNEIKNDSYDSNCSLMANFTNDQEFFLFIDIADGPITSGAYSINYVFNE